MGLIESGLQWLGEQRRKADGLAVTYLRGEDSCAISDAVIDIGELQLMDGSVIRTIETREYLIAPEDLMLGGVQAEPKRGDRITEVRGNVTLVQEVMELPGFPAWNYEDPARSLLRVRTKKVG